MSVKPTQLTTTDKNFPIFRKESVTHVLNLKNLRRLLALTIVGATITSSAQAGDQAKQILSAVARQVISNHVYGSNYKSYPSYPSYPSQPSGCHSTNYPPSYPSYPQSVPYPQSSGVIVESTPVVVTSAPVSGSVVTASMNSSAPVANPPAPVLSNTDLLLEDIQLEAPATVVAGPAYRVRFRNQGSQDAGKFVVAIFAALDGNVNEQSPKAVIEVPTLPAQQATEVVLRLPQAVMMLTRPNNESTGDLYTLGCRN